jgi:hypothetical protein
MKILTHMFMSKSRRSAGVGLLVGVLAGVTVGGGVVGVFAASSTETVTVCAKKNTNFLRYAEDGQCASNETKVLLNQTGASGAKGDTGATGAKGDTGEKGAPGTNGTDGTNGTNGTDGTDGTDGVDATVAITQQSVCDGSDADTVADELCKIGMTGPGGGIIFFVDYNDQYQGLDYLEAARVGWGNAMTVNQGGLTGETTGSSTVDPKMKWCSNTSSSLGLTNWTNFAVGAGASNTSTADTTCAGGAIQAAADYAGGSKTDWYLPSSGEAMLMYTNLRQTGVDGFALGFYWTSSEVGANNTWFQGFISGDQNYNNKPTLYYVRPVRAF